MKSVTAILTAKLNTQSPERGFFLGSLAQPEQVFLVSSFVRDITIKARMEAEDRQFEKLWQRARNGSEEAMDEINRRLGGTFETKIVSKIDVRAGTSKTEIKKLRSEYDKLAKEADKVDKIKEGSVTRLRQQLNAAKQERDGIKKTVKILNAKGRRVSVISEEWKKANEEVKKYKLELAKEEGDIMGMLKAQIPGLEKIENFTKAMGPFVQAGMAVVQTFQAINQAIRPIVQRQKQVEGLTLAMKGFGLSSKEAGQILGASKQIAMEYGANLSNLEKGFKRITPAILQNGGSLRDAAEVMTAISARTTTLGLNTEQAGRYMEAFAQVMGKGKLQSEELNQQFSELDGALRGQLAAAAKAMYGIEDLNEAMQAGAISSDMFQKMFVEVSQSMVDNLGGAAEEIQQRLDNMNVAQVENIVNNLNTMSMDSLRESLGGIGKSFQRIWVALSQFFAAVTNNLPNIKQVFTEFFNEVGAISEVVFVGLINGLMRLLQILEQIAGKAIELKNTIAEWPGFKEMIWLGKTVGDTFQKAFREGTDKRILSLGDAVQDTTSKMSELDGRMVSLRNRMLSGEMSPEQYTEEMKKLKIEIAREVNAPWLRQLQKQLADAKIEAKNLKDELKILQDKLAEKKEVFDKEKEGIATLKNAIKTRYKEEIRLSKEAEESIKEKIKTEKDRTREVKDAVKERYRVEKQAIKDNFDAKMRQYDAEIAKLNELSPAERELKEMREDELEAKTKNMNLSKKERLEAQASLDQMKRQEEIQKINEQKKKDQIAKQQQERQLQEQKLQALNTEKALHDKNLTALEAQLKTQENYSEKLKNDQDRYIKFLDDSIKKNDIMKVTLEEIPALVQAQAAAAYDAARGYQAAARAVDTLKRAIKSKDAETAGINQQISDFESDAEGRSVADIRGFFTGGSLKGGEKARVNELGQEAFLTASGRLSMINAKPWEVWKAPTSGTVIPAHLASQLNIPSGGININQKATISANTAANRGASMASIARTIAGGMGSDVVTNNVTVQSVNPTKTASDMLVQLTKLRRRRMY